MINFEVCNLFIVGHVVTRRSKHFPFGDQLQFWPFLICQPKLRRCRCKISFPPSNFSILSHTTPSRTYFDSPNLTPLLTCGFGSNNNMKNHKWDEKASIQTEGGSLKNSIFLRLTPHFLWHFTQKKRTRSDEVQRHFKSRDPNVPFQNIRAGFLMRR